MDLLITNNASSVKLSEKDIVTTHFEESTPSLVANTLSFKGRNGKLNFGGEYSEKKLSYTGYIYANSHSDYEFKRNWLYQLLGNSNPYYITPMYSNEPMYSYESPGETSGNKLGQKNNIESNKRFFVTLEDTFAPELAGSVDSKQIYKINITFVTAVLPFGESKAKKLTIVSGIPYAGTVAASQLEVPFVVKVLAKQNASGIDLTIGSRTWKYSGTVTSGDTFVIGGMYNTMNMLSINDDTNAEYFVLEPTGTGHIDVTCSIASEIVIEDYKELYL